MAQLGGYTAVSKVKLVLKNFSYGDIESFVVDIVLSIFSCL